MIATIKAINRQLRTDTNINVIQANGKGTLPSLPFGTYNITAPWIKGVGREDRTFKDKGNGLELTRFEEFRVTLSFNFYAATNETAIEKALQAKKWFVFFGEDFISSQNATLVEVTSVDNRTAFLVDSYEYKHGFDVRLRMTDIDKVMIDWIETVEIEKMED